MATKIKTMDALNKSDQDLIQQVYNIFKGDKSRKHKKFKHIYDVIFSRYNSMVGDPIMRIAFVNKNDNTNSVSLEIAFEYFLYYLKKVVAPETNLTEEVILSNLFGMLQCKSV